ATGCVDLLSAGGGSGIGRGTESQEVARTAASASPASAATTPSGGGRNIVLRDEWQGRGGQQAGVQTKAYRTAHGPLGQLGYTKPGEECGERSLCRDRVIWFRQVGQAKLARSVYRGFASGRK